MSDAVRGVVRVLCATKSEFRTAMKTAAAGAPECCELGAARKGVRGNDDDGEDGHSSVKLTPLSAIPFGSG